jgi:hypothetical protein
MTPPGVKQIRVVEGRRQVEVVEEDKSGKTDRDL